MAIEIKETDRDTLLVNGKEVYRDGETWRARTELTNQEQIALLNYVNKDSLKKTTMADVIAEVMTERRNQDAKWGQQNQHPFAWLAILGEEVGEANKAALETYFKYDGADGDYSNYRAELIQIAAVAVAMVECIDRDNPKG